MGRFYGYSEAQPMSIYIYSVYNIIKVADFPADNTLANFQREALNFKQNQYFRMKMWYT